MLDGAVHRNVPQSGKAFVVQVSDALVRADPDLPVDGFKGVHVAQRGNVLHAHGGKVVSQAAVINAGFLRAEIQVPGLFRIRKDGSDALDPAVPAAEERDDFPVLHGKKVSVMGHPVHQAVGSPADLPDLLPRDPFVRQHRQPHVRTDHRGPDRPQDIKGSAAVLRHRPDAGGRQPVALCPSPDAGPFHEEQAGIV